MLIKAGSTLVVPRGHDIVIDVSSHLADNATISLAPDAPAMRRLVLKAGRKDSVASMARRYRVSPGELAQWNHVATGAAFRRGESIVVFVPHRVAKSTRSASTKRSRAKRVASPRHSPAVRSAHSGKAKHGARTAQAGGAGKRARSSKD
ncbi:MAG: LysM domain-containing protein, partial [Caldimonas sp.]